MSVSGWIQAAALGFAVHTATDNFLLTWAAIVGWKLLHKRFIEVPS